jgi:hypothetical protein
MLSSEGTSQPTAESPAPATAFPPSNTPSAIPLKLAKSSSSTAPIIAASLAGVGGLALLGVLVGCLLVRRRRRGAGENSAAMLGSPPKENDGGYFVARTLSAEKGEMAVLSGGRALGVFSVLGSDSLM